MENRPAPESPVATPRSWADAVESEERQPALFIVMGDLVVVPVRRHPEAAVREPFTQDNVSRCKREIQNIVFENADKIPDGVYKQLMDALLIKD